MPTWVIDKGDSCPKCGASIEVLVEEDNKFDTEKGIEFPKGERCTECDWKNDLRKQEAQEE